MGTACRKSSTANCAAMACRRVVISGWIRVPKSSMPRTKSSKVSSAPLVPGTVRRIAVIGPNATNPCFQGGTFAKIAIDPNAPTPLDALRARYSGTAEILYQPGVDPQPRLPSMPVSPAHDIGDGAAAGMTLTYFADPDGSGEPLSRIGRQHGRTGPGDDQRGRRPVDQFQRAGADRQPVCEALSRRHLVEQRVRPRPQLGSLGGERGGQVQPGGRVAGAGHRGEPAAAGGEQA